LASWRWRCIIFLRRRMCFICSKYYCVHPNPISPIPSKIRAECMRTDAAFAARDILPPILRARRVLDPHRHRYSARTGRWGRVITTSYPFLSDYVLCSNLFSSHPARSNFSHSLFRSHCARSHPLVQLFLIGSPHSLFRSLFARSAHCQRKGPPTV
jgi:hypothetical protein